MTHAAHKIYRFADFTLEVSERRLSQRGQEIYLRPKTFETLLYLVERHGHLVNKNDMLDNLWPDVTVTESALTRCIKELRRALADDAQEPRYLKTIPRLGFKFIAEVDEGAPAPQPESSESEAGPVAPAESASAPIAELLLPKPSLKRQTVIGVLALAVLATLALIWNVVRREKPTLAFAERDWVLVGDFDNRTGEAVFGAALKTALERELSLSTYVNAAPLGRVFDTLKLMKQSPDTKLTEAIGQEVCRRDGGIRALLSGSIHEIGGVYEISVKLIDPASGITLTSLSEEATARAAVLPAIRRLSRQVRERLGESIASISRLERQLERVTTVSLESLESYSKGLGFVQRFDWERARIFTEQAVQRDPDFAMGYLGLGWANAWLGRAEESRKYFDRAAQLIEGVTDREKYFILGSYAYVLGDLRRAIEHYEFLAQLYPDDYWGHENLSMAYLWSGDRRRWEEHKRACLRIRPHYAINHWDLGLFALFTEGDVERAHRELSRALELNPDLPFALAHMSQALRDWMGGELASGEEKMATFLATKMREMIPEANIRGRWTPARFYLFTGKFAAAVKELEASLAAARQQLNRNLTHWCQLELGLTHWELGDNAAFAQLLKSVAAESVGLARVEALGWQGISLPRAGRASQARRLRDELQQETRELPVNITQPRIEGELDRAKRAFSLQIEGEIALSAGDLARAITHFKQVIDLVPPSQIPALTALDPRLYLVAHQSLARAYEQRQEWDAAILAYQTILDHKVLTITVPAASPIWVKALRSISETHAKKGEVGKATTYREQFLRLWPEARNASQ